ncbi:hypothetical protein R5R35_007144 [Gryllus longicercus]|uniref:Uncharacterized protein n=1 Tax=Gryllus longicercus TaxID=2509291 RepID=A0AAN9VIK3_9ORTH
MMLEGNGLRRWGGGSRAAEPLPCRPARSRAPLCLPAGAWSPPPPLPPPPADASVATPVLAAAPADASTWQTHPAPHQPLPGRPRKAAPAAAGVAARSFSLPAPMRKVSTKEPHLTEGQMERRRPPFLRPSPKSRDVSILVLLLNLHP